MAVPDRPSVGGDRVTGLPLGARVAHHTFFETDDEVAAWPELVGTVVDPTAEELEYVKTYPTRHGPDAGDVLVQWDDDEWDRSWEDPDGLLEVTA